MMIHMPNHLIRGGRLYLQYLCDMCLEYLYNFHRFTLKMEIQRLNILRSKSQKVWKIFRLYGK